MKKNLFKLFSAVLLTALMLGISSCATPANDSSSSGPSVSDYLNCKYGLLDEFKSKKVVAWYLWENKELKNYTMNKAYIFFEDNTYCLSDREGMSEVKTEGEEKGTYTGDPKTDGTVKLTKTYIAYNNNGTGKTWKSYNSATPADFVIADKKHTVEYNNGCNIYYRQ